MITTRIRWLLIVALAAAVDASSWTQLAAAQNDAQEFFEKKIRPVLVKHCYECHSADAKKIGGGLLLDHRAGLQKGGDTGPAIVRGKPAESLLVKAIRYDDESLKMPPQGQLPAAVIADFESWIQNGAADPREQPMTRKTSESWDSEFRARREWWSLQPVRRSPIPQPNNRSWSAHAVDQFILAKLAAARLTPADPADPRTLARRLSLVLTGLPPTAEQIADCGLRIGVSKPMDSAIRIPQIAIEAYVDRLLDSPQFGERWARHWMDVVRFSETHGNEWNYEVHHAWRYRDYLIRAFNADVPFDRLIVEHIAGDLLNVGDSLGESHSRSRSDRATFQVRTHPTEHFNESIIGTGFFRFGEVNHDDCISLPGIGYDIADNQIDTLTKAFQATTVACARCHNHKLDAISMEDYYALLGVLRSSRLVSHGIDSASANADAMSRLRELKSDLRKELAAVWLRDAGQVPRYLLAAQAKRANQPGSDELAKGIDAARLEKWIATLAAEKQPFEEPFEPWRRVVGWPPAADRKSSAGGGQATELTTAWKQLAEQFAKENRERTEFNHTQFATFADFRQNDVADWQISGQGLRDGPSPSGDLALHSDGDNVVRAILPSGRFTLALSDKLNGTLRSPVLPLGKKHISFQVIGQRSSAVRLVSNNCQLNYKNYRALTSADWQWVTFSPPDEREQLRTYAELMTMFDNPKFPDQLSALGGDKDNYRLPWDKAAENPRSYFGITRVVLHDVPDPPKPEVTHLRRLFDSAEPKSLADVASRYQSVIESALRTWSEDKATADDVRWLDALLRRELISNNVNTSPRCQDLVKAYRDAEATLVLPQIAAGIADAGPGFDQPVFVRGDCTRPSEAVPRRFVEALSQPGDRFKSSGSGRLELAERIASADNPLTARVIVNRVWHHLFGTGLVRTVDDFGHVGEMPSHPELLDHLASEFVTDGWSIKRLVRRLVLTRTFQMANVPSSRSRDVDPQNRLLQHFPARRLEAEAVRDSILATSGRLDRRLFGPSIQPHREKEYADRRLFPGPLDGDGRRSIYIKNNLMESPKFLAAFNFPGGKVTQGRRDVTNVPAQALALLNDPFVLQQADVWAQRLVGRSDASIADRLDAMFQTALSRSPTRDEVARFEQSIQQLAELHQVPRAEILKSQMLWKDVAHALFNVNEFIYAP